MDKPTPAGVYEIHAQWDSEAGVWVAESEDVPCLVAEAHSPKLLVHKLIPELWALNGAARDPASTPLHILFRHEDSAP